MSNIYIDSKPVLLANEIFRLYQYCALSKKEPKPNTGIMIEDGCFEFIFVKEKDITLQIQDEKPIKLPSCFSLGRLPMPYKFNFPETLSYFAVKVQPWVSSFFFPEECTVKDLSETYGSNILRLHERIFSSDSFEEMNNHVETFFYSSNLPDVNDFKISKEICQHIYRCKGDLKIKELLSQFSQSRQRLNHLFLKQTRNSIKEFAIYVRIREILKYKVNHKNKSLTSIALEFGYFDQSHFIRDMKKVTGLPPSRFLSHDNFFAEQLKFVT